MTVEQLQEQIAMLTAQNAALLAEKQAKGSGLGITAKGCVSLSGLRRFPISFYADEWKAIFAKREVIESYIEANKDRLSYRQ